MSDRSRPPLTIAVMIETVGLGGAEVVVLQLCGELRARGHSVQPVVPAGREGWLLDRFRAEQLPWHTYDLRRPIDWTLPGRMAQMLERLGVDVVHSHEFTTAVYGTAAARRAGLPHIITMHGNQKMTRKWQRRIALRWAFRRSQATVAVSADTQQHLEETLGLRQGRVQVIQNGIPDRPGDRNRVRDELGVGASEVLLLSVGSLTPRKAHAVLLEAMRRVEQSGDVPAWHLAIAGEGPERSRLEAMIEALRLGTRVRLLGPRNDVPDLQAAADIFVLPSLWEGLPLAILEAMFAANPIVASEISGIPEAVEHERHGLLTPPGDVDALAHAIRRLLLDSGERTEFGRAAQERARARFTIGAMTDQYERLYRGLPGTGPDGAAPRG